MSSSSLEGEAARPYAANVPDLSHKCEPGAESRREETLHLPCVDAGKSRCGYAAVQVWQAVGQDWLGDLLDYFREPVAACVTGS
jgi:hypothetical protein